MLADINDDYPSISAFAVDLAPHLLCKFILTESTVKGEMSYSFGTPQGTGIYPADYADPMLKVFRGVKDQMDAS